MWAVQGQDFHRSVWFLPRSAKRAIMVGADLVFLPAALLTGLLLRYGFVLPETKVVILAVLAPAISMPVFMRLGLYRAVVRFMGLGAGLAVLGGVTAAAVLLAAIAPMLPGRPLSLSVFVNFWLVALAYVGGSRLLIRAYFHWLNNFFTERQPIAVYGAGTTGIQLATALLNGREFRPVVFIDANPNLQGSHILGVPVHGPEQLGKLIGDHRIQQVLLALPSATPGERRKILDRLEPFRVHVRTIPTMSDLVSGRSRLDEIREVDVEDLLGRNPIRPVQHLLEGAIAGRSVMVTGAGGSIGSELCRQIVLLRPRRLVLWEMSEFGLYRIATELRGVIAKHALDVELVECLGSVLEGERLQRALRRYEVASVFHAAAYKHVPIVEANPIEGFDNNALGTLSAARAAEQAGVDCFLLVSTDKAVRPTNVMGATKRVAELILQARAQRGSRTRFCMVRFGNVLDSSGSVVPLFRDQIRRGGPVTVTHPEVTRFFMTIPEAAQLVIQAASIAQGGEVFVLDMGEPIRIRDLARRMIRLMGFEVRDKDNADGDIAIVYSGLRPGEKLYEELLIGENATGTEHPKIVRAVEEALSPEQMDVMLDRLRSACDAGDENTLLELMAEVVEGYRPEGPSAAADSTDKARTAADNVTPLFR